MNRHVIFDKIMLWTFKTLGRPFFEDSVKTSSFETHLANVTFAGPEIVGSGAYEFTVHSLGEVVTQAVNVLHYVSATAPLVVYNMGGGEAPYDSTVKRIYPEPDGFNVVAIEAPYQRSRQEIAHAFSELNNYMAMLAMTVKMNEHVLQAPVFVNARKKLVAGMSLGGFVANRHHLVYNTADIYVPFVAGTRHGDIFLTTVARSGLTMANPQVLRTHLNFEEEWLRREHHNVFPQLNRYDQLNQLEVQQPSFGEMPTTIWEGGHMYHVIHPRLARAKLDELIDK